MTKSRRIGNLVDSGDALGNSHHVLVHTARVYVLYVPVTVLNHLRLSIRVDAPSGSKVGLWGISEHHDSEEGFRDPRRIALLNNLERRIGITVPPTVWGCLWLSGIEKLEEWVERANREPPQITRLTFDGIETTGRIVQIWTQRDRLAFAATTPRPSTPSSTPGDKKRKHDDEQSASEATLRHRPSKAAALCQQRDQGSCIITKAGDVDVAHICPFSMRSYKQFDSLSESNIWETLRVFWSDDRVKAWHDAVFPDGNFVEACHNLICLNPLARRHHGNGYFALKPIELSDDKKRLKVKFFWLQKSGSLRRPNKAKLYNHDTDDKICSGDELYLETHDPVNFPLPSLELLEMQWILNRLTAIRGAAEEDDFYHDDDEDGQFPLQCGRDLDEWCSKVDS